MTTAGKLKLIRMWGLGLVMFGLRLHQLRYDFDSKTLLHTPSAAGTALAVLAAAAAVVLFVLSRWESKKKPLFHEHFAAPEKSTPVLIAGGFLMAFGGVMPVISVLMKGSPSGGILQSVGAAQLASAVLAAAAGIGFMVLTAQMRRGEARSLVPVLPAVFFAAFWVLAQYLPSAEDPVLARYYLPILAASAAAYAFAELGGFFRGDTKVRNFSFAAEYAVVLCIAACARLEIESLVYVGCALILSVFLSLQRKKSE